MVWHTMHEATASAIPSDGGCIGLLPRLVPMKLIMNYQHYVSVYLLRSVLLFFFCLLFESNFHMDGYVCMVYGIFDFQFPTVCVVVLFLHYTHKLLRSAILMTNTHTSYIHITYILTHREQWQCQSAYKSTLMCCVRARCLLLLLSLLWLFLFTLYISILRSFFFLLRSLFVVHTFESTLLRHLVSGIASLLSPELWAT